MYYSIYQTTNKINGKIYVGTHITEDLDDRYLGSGKRLLVAINKYGRDNFEKEVLFIFATPEKMFEIEANVVNEDFITRTDTYNIKVGGKGGGGNSSGSFRFRSKEFMSAQGKANYLKNRLWEYAKNQDRFGIHNNFYGRTHTEETKKIIGEKSSIYQKGNRNSQYGTCWITNGIENKKIKKEDLDLWILQDWRRGRI